MSILADVILCAIVLLCVLLGFFRGFIKSFVEFIGYFVALIVSAFLSNALSVFVYHTFLRDILTKKISTAISTSATLPTEQKVQAVFQALPGFVTNSMGYHGITAEKLSKTLSTSAASAAPTVADMISPIIIGSLKIVLAIIIFILLLMLVRFLARALDIVCRLPVLHQLNALLGGVFGLLKGLVIVFLLCALVQVVAPVMQGNALEYVQKTMNNSYILKTINQNNPTYLLLK